MGRTLLSWGFSWIEFEGSKSDDSWFRFFTSASGRSQTESRQSKLRLPRDDTRELFWCLRTRSGRREFEIGLLPIDDSRFAIFDFDYDGGPGILPHETTWKPLKVSKIEYHFLLATLKHRVACQPRYLLAVTSGTAGVPPALSEQRE